MKKPLYICFLAAGLLTGCGTEQPTSTVAEKPQETNLVQLTPAQLRNANVVTAKPERKTIATALQVNGVMEAPPQNLVSDG